MLEYRRKFISIWQLNQCYMDTVDIINFYDTM